MAYDTHFYTWIFYRKGLPFDLYVLFAPVWQLIKCMKIVMCYAFSFVVCKTQVYRCYQHEGTVLCLSRWHLATNKCWNRTPNSKQDDRVMTIQFSFRFAVGIITLVADVLMYLPYNELRLQSVQSFHCFRYSFNLWTKAFDSSSVHRSLFAIVIENNKKRKWKNGCSAFSILLIEHICWKTWQFIAKLRDLSLGYTIVLPNELNKLTITIVKYKMIKWQFSHNR